MSFVWNYLRNLGSLGAGREPVRPLLFSYYVTHRCHLNCRYCCDGDGKRFREDAVPELDTTQARQLLSRLRPAGDTLDLTGGEPLVRDDLEEILAHARALGFRTVLNTKGSGLENRPEITRLTEVLVLSIDTLDPGELARVLGRPVPAAEQVLAALHYAVAKRRETGLKVVLAAVATPENLAGVFKVLQFAMEHALGFQLSPEIVGTRVHPALRGNPEYRRLVEETLRMKRTRRGVLGVPEYLAGIRDFGSFECHPLLMPVIRPDGRMYYPCLESKQAEINLLDHENYGAALAAAQRRQGRLPGCRDCCHLFCHMALSLLQAHPLSAWRELKHWNTRYEPV
jgi:MoaA/NifB/PqqE/SkfB family radical SAM enzyme